MVDGVVFSGVIMTQKVEDCGIGVMIGICIIFLRVEVNHEVK